VSCCWVVECPFVLVNLGTERTGLGATEESELVSFPVVGGGGKQVCSELVKMCQLQGLGALKQQAQAYCLLKGWNANYKSSVICGQAAGVVCDKTAGFPCEVQTCNWTESHAVDLNVEGM
jgi:hypothetical protein